MPKRQMLPTQAASRWRLLERIRTAHFPRDSGKFTLPELQLNGFCDKYPKNDGISESSYKLLVLLANQAEDFRSERDRSRAKLERLQPYCSPFISEAMKQVDPLERERLLELAKEDEARQRAAKQQSEADRWKSLLKIWGGKPWECRDERTQPRRAYLWHEPMTWVDYHRATGLSRRTIHNVLKRLKAAPLSARQRKNEPSRFGPDVNLAVLREWLAKYVKQTDHRRAWLAQILLKYRHEALDEFDWVVQALWPVIKSLGIDTPDGVSDFREYINECDRVLYPTPPPSQGALGISAISAILNKTD